MRDKRPEKMYDDHDIRADYIRHFTNYDEKEKKKPLHPKFAIYDNNSDRFDCKYFFDFMEQHTNQQCIELLDNCVRTNKLTSYKFIGYYLVIKERKYNFVVLNLWNKTRIPIKSFIEDFVTLSNICQTPFEDVDVQDTEYVYVLLKLKVLEYIRYNFDTYILSDTFDNKIDKDKYVNIEKNDFIVAMTEKLRDRFKFKTLKDKKRYSDVFTRELKKAIYHDDNPRLGINKPDIVYETDLVTIRYNQYEFDLSKEGLEIYFIKQGNHLQIFRGSEIGYTSKEGPWNKDIDEIKKSIYEIKNKFIKSYLMFINANKNKVLDELNEKIEDFFEGDFEQKPQPHSPVHFVDNHNIPLKPQLEPNVKNTISEDHFHNPRRHHHRK